MNDQGYEANIAALRDEYPGLSSLEQCLRGHGWENAEVPSGARAQGQSPGAARDGTMEA